jgi:hypothetical protein
MHNESSIDMFGQTIPTETIVDPIDLLDSIVAAAEDDIYTDAPESAGQVALLNLLIAKARKILPPTPVDVTEAQVHRAIAALAAIGYEQKSGRIIDGDMPLAHHRYILVEMGDIDDIWLSAHRSPDAALRYNMCDEPQGWTIIGLWDVAAERWYEGQATITERFDPPAQDSSGSATTPS